MATSLNIAMTRDRLLVRPVTDQKIGKLYLPNDVNKRVEVPLGEVFAVGPGIPGPDGALRPVGSHLRDEEGNLSYASIQPGNKVYYLQAGAVRQWINGVEYFVIHEPSVVALASVSESLIEIPA